MKPVWEGILKFALGHLSLTPAWRCPGGLEPGIRRSIWDGGAHVGSSG